MENIVLNVEGMSCEHCVKAVTGAVSALPGVEGVKVALEAKTVTAVYDPALSAPDKIAAEIEALGFDVVN